MPIYEYRCQDCQQIFEEWQKHFEDDQASCPVCNGNAQRLISHTSFILKGSGWYVTDYARGKSSDSAANAKGNGEGKAEKKTEQKTEQKTETSSSKETSSVSEKKSNSTSNISTSTSAQ